jgi:hypothetical protein
MALYAARRCRATARLAAEYCVRALINDKDAIDGVLREGEKIGDYAKYGITPSYTTIRSI